MTMMIVITIMNNSTTLWHVWKNLEQKPLLEGGYFKINTFFILKGNIFKRQLKGSSLGVAVGLALISLQLQRNRFLYRRFPSKLSYFLLAKINMQMSVSPTRFENLCLNLSSSHTKTWFPNYREGGGDWTPQTWRSSHTSDPLSEGK